MGNAGRVSCLIAIILCSAAVYLAGNGSVALWDRDEPRYAQTSRQMLQSGDWVVPHFLDKPRTAKPAMIYWCQATAMKIFGDDNFAARFPSAVAITLLLIVLCCVLWKPLGPELTTWTVFIFATSGLTIAAAKMCITDALLLLWITIGQLCIYAMWIGNRSWRVVVTLSVAIGLAGLTKGPVILGIEATTLLALGILLALNKMFAQPRGFSVITANEPATVPVGAAELRVESEFSIILKILVGLLIAVGFVLPWVLMVNHRSSGFILTGLKHDVWDRMMTPLEQHVGPPGYYFLTVWLTFFPWSLLLPLAIGVAIRHWREPRIQFALAAIVGPWIMLECVRTKLPHYFLPVFPPLAFLVANAITGALHGEIKALKSKAFKIIVGIWAVLVVIAGSMPWVVIEARKFLPMPYDAMIAMSILGIIFGLTVFLAFNFEKQKFALIAMGLGTFAMFALMYLWYLPRAEFLRLSPRLAKVLIDHDATHPHQVQMLEYMEPSLAFAQGGTIREAGELGFSKKFEPQLAPWLVLPQSVWDKAPADLQQDYEIVGKEFGFAYADRGKWLWVYVIHHK